jgi:cell division septum initiation protein DivIVA
MSVNLYDEVKDLRSEIDSLKKEYSEMKSIIAWVQKYENVIVDEDAKAKLDIEEDLEGFLTINDIIKKYYCPRSSFYHYQKQLNVKLKVYKVGDRKNKYNKKDVAEFFNKVSDWKSTWRKAS